MRKVELLANIAIVIVATLLSVVLVKTYLLHSPVRSNENEQQAVSKGLQVGKKVNLPEIDWQKNGQTLVLVLSNTCHFCSESASFYQQLAKERGSNTHLVAVLLQPVRDAESYLSRLRVPVDEVRQTSLDSIGVSGTPTLILINGNGEVIDSWVGKLPQSEEVKVLNRLRENTARQ